jgi:hypothetical protein
MARKLALIIGNSQYEDACLSRLAAPDVDVRSLATVLKAPRIGGFDEVTPLLNEGLATVRKAIARFFDQKHRDDLLLLYFSGHGVRDEQGHLYLAVRDTERAVLAGTAIEASYITARMDRSASKRLVLVLDCCHSGAFGYGSKAAQGASVGTATAFEGTGRGRVVLTATDSTQFAWEGDQVVGDVENSLFTHYLIDGLNSGAADRDEDGEITIDELYDYVYEKVLSETPKQTPGKWAYGQQGDIIIAQNPSVTVPKLPPEVEEALKSALPSVRLEILRELNAIARGRHEGRAKAARAALQRLSEDDSRKVATSAFILLQALDQGEALSDEEWQRRVQELEEDLSGRKTAETQISSYLGNAESCLERGALADARTLVSQVLALDPDNEDALRLRARIDQAEVQPSPEPEPEPERPTPPEVRPAGFSFGPTFSAAATWLRARTLSSTAFKTVAGAVVAVAIGWQVMDLQAPLPNSPAPTVPSVDRPSEAPATRTTAAAEPDPPLPAPAAGRGAVDEPLARGSGGSADAGRRGGRNAAPPANPAAKLNPSTKKDPESTSTPVKPTTKPDPVTNPAPPPVVPAATAGEPAREPASNPGTTSNAGATTKTVSAPPAEISPAPVARDTSRVRKPEPDEETLRQSLHAYEAAFMSGSRDAVKAVDPEIPDRDLRDFDRLKVDFGRDRYRMNIVVERIKINGDKAEVVCRIFHNGIDDRGKPQQRDRRETLRMHWTGTKWVRDR